MWVARKTSDITIEDMETYLPNCKPLSSYEKGCIINVRDRMQRCQYTLQCEPARTVSDLKTTFKLKGGGVREFDPHMLPHEILACGVFSGRYLNDCMDEYPREWFEKAIQNRVLDPFVKGQKSNPTYNYYQVHASQSLHSWKENGWLYGNDIRGWLQWFFRYALGRRCPEIDCIQMRRWRAYKRHFARLQKSKKKSKSMSPVTQQGLLQWAWPHKL